MLTAPFQSRPGNASHVTSIFCPSGEAADFRFVDKATHQHLGEIAFLQQQISGLHIRALFHRQRINDAVKRRAHAGFVERIFGCIVGGMGFSALGLHFRCFRFGVAVFLFFFQQVGVSLGALQCFFSLLHFTGRGCALLLKASKRVQIALGIVLRAAGLDQLGIQRKNFFVRATAAKIRLFSLRRFNLSLCAGCLAAQIAVIELQEQLPFADVIAFLHHQAFHRGRDRGMSFKILDGFHFTIGRDQAPDGTALHSCDANLQRRLASEKGDRGQGSGYSYYHPCAAFSRGGMSVRIMVGSCQIVIFQGAAGTSASLNLPLWPLR